MTEELLEAELDQYKRPKFKVSTPALSFSLMTFSCLAKYIFFLSPGGVVVWSSRFGEDHFGSHHSKACWVQCGGNQCQVSQTK